MNHPEENIIIMPSTLMLSQKHPTHHASGAKTQQKVLLINKKKKKKKEFLLHHQLSLIQCVCVFNGSGSALVYMLDGIGCQPQFPGMPLQKPGVEYSHSWREIRNQRGRFRGDGKDAAVEEKSDGRG